MTRPWQSASLQMNDTITALTGTTTEVDCALNKWQNPVQISTRNCFTQEERFSSKHLLAKDFFSSFGIKMDG